ncbi:DUF1206 domain-containing protein [Mumia sp. ZJ1417]|uniref:DUF1206 domain-containing protein n=1 Tax=Mumia sp. ZJ1417 TaxID=2708082 RepID=UPI00141E07CF|nr:DUF1206 domain-containing protein [Mumia sp. ZJ1417]QMW67186.1 DUF1206 domain-containing protein [Mumia sp. ZJ1417]
MTNVKGKGKGKQAGREVRDSKALEVGARVGLVAYGIVHLLVAWIALQVAWGGTQEDASQSGALAMVSESGPGKALLWVTAVGFVALVLWQLADAVWGFRDKDGAKRTFKRVSAAGKAVLYGALAVLAARQASGTSGGGGSGGSGGSEETLTARVMGAPGGPWIVALVGLATLALAGYQGYRGVTRSFEHDLDPSASSGTSGSAIVRLGQVGYVAKGIALAIIGVLFILAAIDHDPDRAGGLDDALRTLREQPFGPYLLTLVALGLAAFGAYCFGWARHVKRR